MEEGMDYIESQVSCLREVKGRYYSLCLRIHKQSVSGKIHRNCVLGEKNRAKYRAIKEHPCWRNDSDSVKKGMTSQRKTMREGCHEIKSVEFDEGRANFSERVRRQSAH